MSTSTAKAPTTTVAQSFRLLDLFPEMVTKVITFAIPSHGTVYIVAGAMDNSSTGEMCNTPIPWAFADRIKGFKYFHRVPALLRVCRMLRDEGSRIYYGTNTFRLHSTFVEFPRALEGLLIARGRGIQHLRRVTVETTVCVYEPRFYPGLQAWKFDAITVYVKFELTKDGDGHVGFGGWEGGWDTAFRNKNEVKELGECKVRELIAGPGTFLEVLREVVEGMGARSVRVESRLEKKESCPGCKKILLV